jgi:hypothetical protein
VFQVPESIHDAILNEAAIALKGIDRKTIKLGYSSIAYTSLQARYLLLPSGLA